jgi:hypothetical protein
MNSKCALVIVLAVLFMSQMNRNEAATVSTGGFGGAGVSIPVGITLPSCPNVDFLTQVINAQNALGLMTISNNLPLIQQADTIVTIYNNLYNRIQSRQGYGRGDRAYGYALQAAARDIIQYVQQYCINDLGAQDVIQNLSKINYNFPGAIDFARLSQL